MMCYLAHIHNLEKWETMNKKATRHKPTITSGLVRAQGYQL